MELIGVLTVEDFRDFESWRLARFAVCSVLDFAKSLSRIIPHQSTAKDIDKLSVSILDNLVRGFEGSGDAAYLNRALESVDRLDDVLRRTSHQGIVTKSTSARLQRELKAVRQALQNTPYGSAQRTHNRRTQ